MYQRRVFRFGITDQDGIVRTDQKYVGNFPLCREGLARTGGTQNQAIGVLQLSSVHHNHVVGKRVQAIVQGFSLLEQLLCSKGNENGCGTGSQAAFDGNQVHSQRKAAHQAIFLPVIQTTQAAVCLLRNTGCLE